jgi:hypothetical protein
MSIDFLEKLFFMLYLCIMLQDNLSGKNNKAYLILPAILCAFSSFYFLKPVINRGKKINILLFSALQKIDSPVISNFCLLFALLPRLLSPDIFAIFASN